MFKILFLAIYTTLIFAHLFENLICVFTNLYRQKMLDEYHEFSMKVLDWSKEIKDLNKRSEMLNYHITYISTSHLEEVKLKWKQMPEFQKYIEDNWGGYIPSLKQKIRERKINSILE